MLLHSRDEFATNDISILVDTQDAIEYLNSNFDFYKENNQELRSRVLNPYVQTSAFINEAINLKQGRISAEEKSGRRKDRVMSMVYGLDWAKQLEDQLSNTQESNLFDFMYFM